MIAHRIRAFGSPLGPLNPINPITKVDPSCIQVKNTRSGHALMVSNELGVVSSKGRPFQWCINYMYVMITCFIVIYFL